MLRYRTAGESHGRCILAVVEGLPAGLRVRADFADESLALRREGTGRSPRMSIEDDRVEIISGIYRGRSTGAPVVIVIANRDERRGKDLPPIVNPRPGHADLAAILKYHSRDARPVAERAGGRETSARCAAGALAAVLLREFGVDVLGYVVRIKNLSLDARKKSGDIRKLRGRSKVYCPTPRRAASVLRLIESVRGAGDTLGGEFEVRVEGAPPGLGSVMQWDERLDARLACAVMAIPSVKGVQIGAGFALAGMSGLKAHDGILPGGKGACAPRRSGNNSGGIEGGMSNGQPIVLRAAVKPVPTTRRPHPSIDTRTGAKSRACVERADICVVPAISIVGESVVAFEIARAMREKFGGDTLVEMKRNYRSCIRLVEKMWRGG